MGVRYSEDGAKPGFLVTCVARSSIRPEVVIRKQQYLGIVSLKEAQEAYRNIKREVFREKLVRERGQVSWRHLLEHWYRNDVLMSTTPTTTKVDNYRTLMRHTKNWLNTSVDQLNSMSLQMVFNDMIKAGLSRGRLKAVKSSVNVVFEWGVLNRIIPPMVVSPARGVLLPKAAKKMKPVLNKGEIQILLGKAREMNHEYYPVWAVGFETGCRSGELWALRWTDVDFQRGEISITKSFQFR